MGNWCTSTYRQVRTIPNDRPIGFTVQPPSKTCLFSGEFRQLSRVRSTGPSEFMQRAMGIEPTSEAWEARNITQKHAGLAAFSRVLVPLNWKIMENGKRLQCFSCLSIPLWSRLHIWKLCKSCSTRSYYAQPIGPHGGLAETAPPWCVMRSASTCGDWQSAIWKNATGRAIPNSATPAMRGEGGKRRLCGHRNKPGRRSTLRFRSA